MLSVLSEQSFHLKLLSSISVKPVNTVPFSKKVWKRAYRRCDKGDVLWNLVCTDHITFYLCPSPSFPYRCICSGHTLQHWVRLCRHIHIESVHIWAGISHKALVRRKSVICHRITFCQPTPPCRTAEKKK